MAMNRALVLLSTQRALVGMITKNMKAITIGFSETTFTIRVYFQNPYSEQEFQLLKDITGEVSADVPGLVEFKEEALVVGSMQPNQLENLNTWVYMEHHTPVLT